MAQGTKVAAAPAATPTTSSNGVHAAPPSAPTGVNRKKQKRREKEAAKKAAEAQKQSMSAKNGVPPAAQPPAVHNAPAAHPPAPQYAEAEYDEGVYEEEGEYYSDEDGEIYDAGYAANGHYQSGYAPAAAATGTGKKSKKKKRGQNVTAQNAYPSLPNLHPPQHPSTAPRPPPHAQQNAHQSSRKSSSREDRIWNTSTMEERERIREFWLSLGEDERKSLVKIEKEAVLRKMKEQQKQTCSCSVCGRKRTAIEEELEVLYDAYYDELEGSPQTRTMMSHPPPGAYDDTDDLSGDEDDRDQDFSNSEISSEEDYSDDERSLPPPEQPSDFLQFGSSLQVKGGILTVADDLLKNDGKKFIEMMEQLAERRMQREEEASFQAHPSTYRTHNQHSHPHAPPEDDEFDDEEDEDDGYDDADYDEDDDDEDDTMTEEQRMEEGRRMFQIFAARMFEQRVLQAYREKVAAERQQKLLEELAEEDGLEKAKEAKKAKEAQKRKEKKDKQRQQKAEEKAKKDADKAAKEAELKAAEEKRLEEQRRKREEQRKKKEMERKAQEEEKLRKEAERMKRQQEERERQQEAERKLREQKALEKKAKEEAKRKEREEREAREKEAREKKAHDDKERREREAKVKAEKERLRKEEQAATAGSNPPASSKKSSQPVAVALPPQLLKQTSSTGYPSPHVTPAVPKAPTPNRPRQASQQGSHGSSPKASHASTSSKPMSPVSQAQVPVVPKSILTKPPTAQQSTPASHPPASPMPPIGLPPGLPPPPHLMGLGSPPGMNGFPSQGSMLAGMIGPTRNMAMFPPQQGAQNFRPFPPPGMLPNQMPIGRGFGMDPPPPPVFGPPPGFPGPNPAPGYNMGMPTHSRQASGSYEKTSTDSPIAAPPSQPIQRPAPIQRPSSVKPVESARGNEVDELAAHLGSKALLDDEEDMPEFQETARRTSLQQHGSVRGLPLGFSFPDAGQARPDLHGLFPNSGSPSMWGGPPIPFPIGANTTWANSPTSNVFPSSFSMVGAPRGNADRGPNEVRMAWLRRMICSTCKMLSMRQGVTDGYIDAAEVHSYIESARAPSEPIVTQPEIREAVDIIGDGSNGGGSLEYKESAPGRLSHIKYVEAGGPPPTLGEIGSPRPGNSVPQPIGFGGARGPLYGLGQQVPGLGPQTF